MHGRAGRSAPVISENLLQSDVTVCGDEPASLFDLLNA